MEFVYYFVALKIPVKNCCMRLVSLFFVALAMSISVQAQFPAPYCTATFSSGVRPITRVSFHTISNQTPVTPDGGALEDFTSQTANILSGTRYTITVSGSTGGNNLDYCVAYFDWNQDGDFIDMGEAYYIGILLNSTGTDGMTASNSIRVPSTAREGVTRMRVL